MKNLRNLSLLLLFTVLILPANAQHEKLDLEMIYKIKQEGLKNSHIEELSFYMTDFLGPRIPNSTNGKNAQIWTRAKMEEFGLKNARLEEWGEFGRGWDNKKTYIAMTVPYYNVLIGTPKAWTPGTNGMVSSRLMLVDIKDEKDFEDYKGKLKDKIVILPSQRKYEISFGPMASRYTDKELEELTKPSQSGGRRNYTEADRAKYRAMRQLRTKISSFLKEEGVLAVLTTSGYFGVPRGSGVSAKADAPPTVPEILLTGEHHGRMIRLMEHDIEVDVEMDIQND